VARVTNLARALAELKQLERLLHPDVAQRLSLLLKDRITLDKRLQSGSYQKGEVSGLRRSVQRRYVRMRA